MKHGSIGWGFIGVSTIAREHMLSAVRAQPGNEVVAVASADTKRAREFAQEFGIGDSYGDVDTLLANPNVNAVYISSTNDKHRDQALAAIAAGKHVLCEKPLALSVADAQSMVEAANRAGLVFATNHHLRNAATHRKMRELVRGGAIGKPLFARIQHAIYLRPQVQGWRVNSANAGGGVILDIGVHAADTLRFALDAEVVEVVGMRQKGFLSANGVEDGVMAVVRMSNGVLGQIHAAYTVRHAQTSFEIHGEQGSLTARDSLTVRAAGDLVLVNADGQAVLPVDHEPLYVVGVRQFCAALGSSDIQPAASGDDGVQSLKIALAIAQSCSSGAAVMLRE